MLENREYMRQPRSQFRWTATTVLLAINIVVFLLGLVLRNPYFVNDYLALSPGGLRHGFLWQLFTFQFLHSGWVHLLLNCFALFVFGREVENILGTRRFLGLYLVGGVIGGLFQIGLGLIWPHYFGSSVVGASAGILGVVAAFATLFPERELTMLLFFVIPVNLRAKYLLWISLALAILGIALPHSEALGKDVAHAAHLGGILTGMAFIRWAGVFEQSSLWLRRLRPARSRRSPFASPRPSGKKPQSTLPDPEGFAENPSEEFISREVDPILDKISAHGIQSLTERERKILEAARNRMAKR
jgi:membrane associated rhomboid family serine protease